MEQLFAPVVSVENRRKIVGFSRIDLPSDKWSHQMSRYREMGIVRFPYSIVAVRGERLALGRIEASTADVGPGAPQDGMYQLIGLDGDGRIALQVVFDIEDVDAAIAELDATHARLEEQRAPLENACVRAIRRMDEALESEAWDEAEQLLASDVSVESRRKIVGFSRIDYSPNEWVSEARRFPANGVVRGSRVVIATRGERLALIRTLLGTADESPGAPEDELLHLMGLDEQGRIALHVSFDVEDFDAAMAELDAAHARLEGVRAPLMNAASRIADRLDGLIASRRLDKLGALFTEDVCADDRRRGIRREYSGRATAIAESQAIAELGVEKITSYVIATRGEGIVLSRVLVSGRDERPGSYGVEFLRIVEIDADDQVAALVTFDLDDIDAALEELDARYLAGEAAAQSHTWTLITQTYAALNRQELRATTPDWVNIDHRRITTIEAGGLSANIRAAWEQTPHATVYIEAVYRLSSLGAVLTRAINGTSQAGFDAEWREIDIVAFEGDLINRIELFDEADLDAALTRFDELSAPARRLENGASRVSERYLGYFPERDWAKMAELLADDICMDDRRRVVNAGVRTGRDTEIMNVQFLAEAGCVNITSTPIATRGERLVLARHEFTLRDWPEGQAMVDVVETNADDQLSRQVMFDADDIDAALEELDARYLAGEAAVHAHAWSVITGAYAALNRRELPATTPDLTNIDHRRGMSFAPGDGIAFVRAAWELEREICNRIEAVHRIDSRAAVVTRVSNGTSREGLDAEWREIDILTVDGDLISGIEVFDEADIGAAIARFDELTNPARRLENAASHVYERWWTYLAARDWDAVDDVMADDISTEDRRRVVSAGSLHGRAAQIANMRAVAEVAGENITSTSAAMATRGERLALVHTCSSNRGEQPDEVVTELLSVVEIDADNRIVAVVGFDPDDFDSALGELDRRYLAGEAAAHSHTWSLVVERLHGIQPS